MRSSTSGITIAATAVIGLLNATVAPGLESGTIDTAPRTPGGRHSPELQLAITEIMYHPDASGAEFIELMNIGLAPAMVGGVRFTDGIVFEFPAEFSVQPGSRVVVAGSQEEFAAAYPEISAAGFYSGKLANDGERLALSYAGGRVLLSLRYDDDAPWPTEADGLGNSMVIADAASDPDEPLNWCASAAAGGSPGAAEPVACSPRSDPTDAVFDPDRLLRIEVELDQRDWDALRHQERNLFDIFAGEDCLAEPFGSPFTYFPATVRVDGEEVENVAVRKKGFLGSLSREKPSLKIKFNEYVAGQRYSGLRRLTLNNARQDPSYLNQCLGYGLFRAAALPAPRCNFATVAVNGVDLGLYVHVESVRERFLARHFERNDGTLYEGTLSDFRPEYVRTFEQKTNSQDDDREDLETMIDALGVSDQELVGALEELIDLDAFISFWAMEALLGHWDGYANNTNNFFVYNDPSSDRLHFIPWGADALFNVGTDLDNQPEPPTVLAAGMLSRRLYLYQPTRQLYVDRMIDLLDDVWDETAVNAEIDRMSALVSPFLMGDELDAFNQSVPLIRSYVDGRRDQLLSAMLPEPPVWEQPLREPLCFVEIGEVSASFDTTWGTFDTIDPFLAGSGDLDLVLGEQAVEPYAVGATAGTAEGAVREAVVLLVGALPDGSFVAILIETASALVATGSDLSFDFASTIGLLIRFGPETGYELQLVGLLAEGNLHFEEASTEAGDPIRGSLHATVLESFF